MYRVVKVNLNYQHWSTRNVLHVMCILTLQFLYTDVV